MKDLTFKWKCATKTYYRIEAESTDDIDFAYSEIGTNPYILIDDLAKSLTRESVSVNDLDYALLELDHLEFDAAAGKNKLKCEGYFDMPNELVPEEQLRQTIENSKHYKVKGVNAKKLARLTNTKQKLEKELAVVNKNIAHLTKQKATDNED